MKRKIINQCFLAAGAACIMYYIICGVFTTFGQSMLWIWPLAGTVLLARFAVVHISIKRSSPLPYPKWFITLIRLSFALAVALFMFVEAFVLSGFRYDCPQGVDYVIILGAKTGSVTIEARMDRACEYLIENPETKVIVTGGQGSDEEMSEGEYMRLGLMRRGIDASRIIVENKSTSTAENLEFSKALISDSEASIAIVSNNYHIFRAVGIAGKYFNGEIYGIPMASNPISLPHYMVREFLTVVVDSLRGNLVF